MNKINRWVGYISITIVLIFGVLMALGMIGDFKLYTRLMVAGAIFAYVLLRLIFLFHTHHKRADRDEFRA